MKMAVGADAVQSLRKGGTSEAHSRGNSRTLVSCLNVIKLSNKFRKLSTLFLVERRQSNAP